MKVPLLDLKAQYKQIKKDVHQSLDELLASQHFILGPVVTKFEQVMAEYIGAKYGIGVASGSDALLLSLMALGIKTGDEVLTSPFTFFATAGAISRLNATPVFADIEPITYNISPAAIEKLISQQYMPDPESGKLINKKTRRVIKAIIPVHLYGQCVDMDEIMALAKKYKWAVIEDAAQAISSIYKNKSAGTIGTTGCFSFFPSKNLGAWGDAGLITTNDQKMAELLKSLRIHGGTKKYHHKYVGCNSRLDALQAAILTVKLKYLDDWQKARMKNAERYAELFQKANLLDKISLPTTKENRNHTYHQYTIRVLKNKRNDLAAFLKQNEVGTAIYYPLALHLQECFKNLGYQPGTCPESEKAAEECVSLPIYPELTSEMQNYVVDKMKEFFSK
ncbi:MAG: DegT/DnrJ/EryC1/StrS family aminotransferase [Planctomycetes bacterium]|nr:DegT/DnrJ/EryC1/StrS family aminotransferase [Planctomycetota bacterium]